MANEPAARLAPACVRRFVERGQIVMQKSPRLLSLLVGTALISVLSTSCAENGTLFAAPSGSPSASAGDRALASARAARANDDRDTAAKGLAYLVSVAPDNGDVLGEYAKVLTEMGQPHEALAY